MSHTHERETERKTDTHSLTYRLSPTTTLYTEREQNTQGEVIPRTDKLTTDREAIHNTAMTARQTKT